MWTNPAPKLIEQGLGRTNRVSSLYAVRSSSSVWVAEVVLPLKRGGPWGRKAAARTRSVQEDPPSPNPRHAPYGAEPPEAALKSLGGFTNRVQGQVRAGRQRRPDGRRFIQSGSAGYWPHRFGSLAVAPAGAGANEGALLGGCHSTLIHVLEARAASNPVVGARGPAARAENTCAPSPAWATEGQRPVLKAVREFFPCPGE